MKLLVLTAATGGGHIRAGNGIVETVARGGEHQAVAVDALKEVGWLFDKLICGSYLFMARRCPRFFGRMYRQSNKKNLFSGLIPTITSWVSGRLMKVIARERPDAIVTTHPFAASMAAALRQKGKVSVPVLSLITDYGVHRAYLAENRCDGYIVACDDMIPEAEAWGVPREKVHPFGIPVMPQFFEKVPRPQARKALGLDPDLPLVLFMAGSFGVSNILGIFRDLQERMGADRPLAQLVVITGRNEKLYQTFQTEIARGTKLPTQLLFFTNEVEKYMHAADLLVTKPGGLTVSEALASDLPLAAFDAIPGQEEDNAAFLERHGMAIRMKTDTEAGPAIAALMADPHRLAAMREAVAAFDKSQCVPNILALCTQLSQQSGPAPSSLKKG